MISPVIGSNPLTKLVVFGQDPNVEETDLQEVTVLIFPFPIVVR